MAENRLSKLRRVGRRLGLGLGLMMGLYLLILATYNYWLPSVSKFLTVFDPLKKSELIVVSTGSYSRFRYALDLWKKGYAPKLLLVGDQRLKVSVIDMSTLEMARDEALDEGIPKDRLIVKNSTSTRDDAFQAFKVMRKMGINSATVVSDRYNMKRLAMIFDDVNQEDKLNLIYVFQGQGMEESRPPDRWWVNGWSFSYVTKELIKLPVSLLVSIIKGKGA